MAKIALRVVCAVLLATCVQGCFFLDIKCKVEEFIDKETSQLIGKAKLAFEQAMDHVFDQDILPLIDKVQAAVDAGIDKVDKYVNETINHIETSIHEIIHDAAQTANDLASNVTHDIEEIISKAVSAIEQVEKTFYRDASNLLGQINQIVHKGQCMEASGAKQIQNAIYKLLKSLDPLYRFSSCWRSLGFKVTMSLYDLTEIQLYNFQKECTLLNKITPNTPIKGPGGILQTYAQGQLYAAEYFCIGETANAPAFRDVLAKEWLWWGVQYNAWNTIRVTSKNLNADQGSNTVQQLKDDPCGTPVECYEQAIEALKEAEQKILSIKTGLSDLNQTVKQVIANQTQINSNLLNLKANTSANGQEISVNTNGIEINKNSISTNGNSINSNSHRLSTLRAYPCGCKNNMNKRGMCSSGVSVGFSYYCRDASCSNSWSPVMETTTGTGIRCCNICMGTAEEAAAYALENPVPPAVMKECKNTDMPATQDLL